MSPRKPTRIADTPNLPTLPTIKDYFAMMAEGQGDRDSQAETGVNGEKHRGAREEAV